MRLPSTLLLSSALILFAAISHAGAKQPARSDKTSYYPHWVARDGTVTDAILKRLRPGSIVAVHHEWPLSELRRILNASGSFTLSWYVEANVQERNDPAPRGTPVAARIATAQKKQATLVGEYGKNRFANLIELDGARDKYEGSLRGVGNNRKDWEVDAAAAKAAGFRYVAKSPSHAHVKDLRAKFGADFVPRIVFEDVTGSARDKNPGYRRDAKALAADGETVTLIVHEGAYGGFSATPLKKARSVVKSDFSQHNVEAYWGRKSSKEEYVKLKDFTEDPTASEPVTDKNNDALPSE